MTPYRERLNAGHYTNSGTTTPSSSTTTTTGDTLTCPNCDRTFNSEHGLKVHQAKTHEGAAA